MSKISKEEFISPLNNFSKDINNDLDIWIEQLKNCYLLQECQLKNLCENVKNNKYYNIYLYREKKY